MMGKIYEFPSPRRANVPRNPSRVPRRQGPIKKNPAEPSPPSNVIKRKNQLPNKKSKIPVKTEPKQQNRKPKLKDMLQMQLFADPASIEITRKNQKIIEEKIKHQIEEKRKELSLNKVDMQKALSEIQSSTNSGRINANNTKTVNQIKMQTFPPFREEPFIVDLGPYSLFDKSTVKTPLPGFSIRDRSEKALFPTNDEFQTEEDDPINVRLDTASEMIYPDGHRVVIKGEPKYEWPPT